MLLANSRDVWLVQIGALVVAVAHPFRSLLLNAPQQRLHRIQAHVKIL